jgi:phosphatidylglycerol:prolipoprotein diacylglycerol transferase
MHPILFEVSDSFFIGTYGVAIAAGLLCAILLASWRATRRGLKADLVFDLAFVAVIGGFLGARILYLIVEWDQFMETPRALLLSRTGFVFQGGFIGGALSAIAFLKWKKAPIMVTGDLIIPSLVMAHGFGRIGCHFAGCCHGGVCEVPGFGIRVGYQETSGGMVFGNAYTSQVEQGLIDPAEALSLPVWPVQLMESAALFALAGALLWVARVPRRPGLVLGLYLIAYPVLRIALEMLRGDLARGVYFGGLLSTSQIISLALVPVGIGVLVWSRRQPVAGFSDPDAEQPAVDESAPVDDMERRIRERARKRGA